MKFEVYGLVNVTVPLLTSYVYNVAIYDVKVGEGHIWNFTIFATFL